MLNDRGTETNFTKDVVTHSASNRSITASRNPTKPLRVLQIGQDDLFGKLPNVHREFISTGHSITPAAENRQRLRLMALLRILSGLSEQEKWDVIVLPVVDFEWPHDRSILKRGMRYLLRGLLCNRLLATFANRLLQRSAAQIAVVERFDMTTIAEPFLKKLPCVRSYFKANLLEDNLIEDNAEAEHLGDGKHTCRLIHLPYWITESRYPKIDSVKKETDVLFVGAANSSAREHGIQVLKRLASEGYRCVVSTQRISFEEYLRAMAGAWLTLSPEGFGYTCFRHYEAMMMHSIPVINRPSSPIVNDFVDGENCLLYETPELYDLLRSALDDTGRLADISSGLRDFALHHHSRPSVGSYILRQLGVINEQAEEIKKDAFQSMH